MLLILTSFCSYMYNIYTHTYISFNYRQSLSASITATATVSNISLGGGGGDDNNNDDSSSSGKVDSSSKSVDPVDSPPGTIRSRLLHQMTSIDSSIKRYASELVYELCDCDDDILIKRAGFGNAIGLLSLKMNAPF